MDRSHGITHHTDHERDRSADRVTVVLQAVVDRPMLDTFDLWTRYEALPRLRRRHLVGDAAAVARSSGRPPRVAPSAITVVEGPDGYAATVWIRALDDSAAVVSLVVDDPARTEPASRDLARFVEFALVETMELALASPDICGCLGVDAPALLACPLRSRGRLSSEAPGYRSPMNDERFPPAAADRMPTPEEEQAAERAAEGVDLDRVAAHAVDMAETGANVRGEGQIEPEA